MGTPGVPLGVLVRLTALRSPIKRSSSMKKKGKKDDKKKGK